MLIQKNRQTKGSMATSQRIIDKNSWWRWFKKIQFSTRKGNEMKKILWLLLSVGICGCTTILTLRTNGIPRDDPTDYWIHIHTKEKLSGKLYMQCFDQATEEVIKKHQLPKDDNLEAKLYKFRYEEAIYQGKCLREHGFIFSPKIFSNYCYHDFNKIDCKAFRQYMK